MEGERRRQWSGVEWCGVVWCRVKGRRNEPSSDAREHGFVPACSGQGATVGTEGWEGGGMYIHCKGHPPLARRRPIGVVQVERASAAVLSVVVRVRGKRSRPGPHPQKTYTRRGVFSQLRWAATAWLPGRWLTPREEASKTRLAGLTGTHDRQAIHARTMPSEATAGWGGGLGAQPPLISDSPLGRRGGWVIHTTSPTVPRHLVFSAWVRLRAPIAWPPLGRWGRCEYYSDEASG